MRCSQPLDGRDATIQFLILWTDGSNRRFKFDKCRQFFIGSNNEPLSVVAMRVSNPDRSPAGINR
jgi:hypothetical protein